LKSGNLCYYDSIYPTVDGLIYLVLPSTDNVKNLFKVRYGFDAPMLNDNRFPGINMNVIFGPELRPSKTFNFHTSNSDEVKWIFKRFLRGDMDAHDEFEDKE
jgi:hypothetical protein